MALKGGAQWTIATAREYLSFEKADPWAGYWTKKQTLAAGDEDTRLTDSGGFATVGVTRACVLPVCSPSRRAGHAPKRRIKEIHGCALDRLAFALLRSGLDPGQALFGDRERGQRALQHARQGRLAPEAAVRLREGPDRRRARRDGQGLRVRERPLRHLPARRAEGAAGEPEPHDRHRRLHSRQGGRSDLLRQGLLPRPRQARRQALQPADARRCARAAAAPSPSGPGRPSSTWSRCARPKTAWCCSSCSTPTKCAR